MSDFFTVCAKCLDESYPLLEATCCKGCSLFQDLCQKRDEYRDRLFDLEEEKRFLESKNLHKCGSCKLIHPSVECSGIIYCPNALCQGAGGAWFRSTLDSYRELYPNPPFHGEHTVDEEEWKEKGTKYNEEHGILIRDWLDIKQELEGSEC